MSKTLENSSLAAFSSLTTIGYFQCGGEKLLCNRRCFGFAFAVGGDTLSKTLESSLLGAISSMTTVEYFGFSVSL